MNSKSPLTTLCYIENDGKYLMMHRVTKADDVNHGKWIGIGGHFENGESPEECLLREVMEETGLELTGYKFRGLITFISEQKSSEEVFTEYMCLFTGTVSNEAAKGIAPGKAGLKTREGILKWQPKDEVETLELWEGDKIFLELISTDRPFFSLKLKYDAEDNLINAILDGTELLLQGKG